MADLMVHEPLSLEELHAETCLALPERDLMQTFNFTNISGSGSSVFSTAAGTTIVVVLGAPPGM
jgi:hypothetical protein